MPGANVVRRSPDQSSCDGLEALRQVVPMHARHPQRRIREGLGDVLRQIASGLPSLSQPTGPDREIPEQLDADPPAAPRGIDQIARDVPTHREVHMEVHAVFVQLRHPDVRQRLTAEAVAHLPEEVRDMRPQLFRIGAPRRPVGQSSEPVEHVGRAVPANLSLSPPGCLSTRARRITRSSRGAVHVRTGPGRHKATACLTRLRIQRQHPRRPLPRRLFHRLVRRPAAPASAEVSCLSGRAWITRRAPSRRLAAWIC